MGKPLNLGGRLKYPVTIKKLLKRPGQDFVKQEPLFEYTFTTYNEVGDPFGETWQEKQNIFAQWESTADGKIERWNIHEGMVIQRDMAFAQIEEGCSHSVQFAGLCAMCGKDMNEVSFSTEVTDSTRAQINMIHDQTHLTVSQDEASKAEEELQRRLLKHRKLSLVVDLDQTIIHACIEPTIGEWQNDPTSPNYEAVKDVKTFQLNDDGPRGLASGCWYYIKMRPGLKEFLQRISEIYELHVYTMGTRAYAQNIAKIVDPERKLFGDRIISRDENGSMTAKSLTRLFPVDTKMVVIIDDRADVWPTNRPNLIKVTPYDFFVGIGDINSSFLPKREDVPKPTSPAIKAQAEELKASTEVDGAMEVEGSNLPGEIAATTPESSTNSADNNDTSSKGSSTSTTPTSASKVSALEELVSMGAGDNPLVHQAQVKEQEEFLAKQIDDRPLLHLQQKLDAEENDHDESESSDDDDDDVETAVRKKEKQSDHHRHNLLKDDDVELTYLGEHLAAVHKAFYDEYDSALKGVQGGRLAQLRPGSKPKKLPIKDDAADLKIVPDIGVVMPRLK
jgi:RNA polymerase II subunit A-like phosphatase